jgi:hypothetical protein
LPLIRIVFDQKEFYDGAQRLRTIERQDFDFRLRKMKYHKALSKSVDLIRTQAKISVQTTSVISFWKRMTFSFIARHQLDVNIVNIDIYTR